MLSNPNMNNPMGGGQSHMGTFFKFISVLIRFSIQLIVWKFSGSMLVNDMAPGNVGPGGPMMPVSTNQPGMMHQNLNAMNVQSVRNNIF